MKKIVFIKIKDVCRVGDGAHASIKRESTGILYLTSKNFQPSGLSLADVEYISENDYKKYFNPKSTAITTPQKNDILLSIIGSLGSSYVVKENDVFGLSSSVAILRPNPEINSNYLHYWLKSPFFQKSVLAIKSGVAQSYLSLEMIKSLPVSAPTIFAQENIVYILSAYDDLIDTNRRRIQLLEESARLLFREWFVYFRFPGYEKVKIVDDVPEGWKKEKINKLVTFKRGVEPGSDNYLEIYESGSFPFFRVSDLVTRKPSIFVDEQYAKSALLKKSDIVISLDGSVGIVSMGLEGCYSTGIRKLIIKDKKINRAHLYFLMKSHYVQGVINAYAKGTTIQHAGEAIKHMNPILPPQNLMDLFDEIARPALNEILILLEQNQKLAQARDLLLPRLMSGAIEV